MKNTKYHRRLAGLVLAGVALVVALSGSPQLKDRLAIEFGKFNGQRDQFLAEVMGTEVFGPVVGIVEFSGELFGAPPGITAAVS